MAEDGREPLLRLPPPRTLTRKKRKPGFPPPPQRVPRVHAAHLRQGVALAREHLRAVEQRLPALATDVPYVRLDVAPKATLSDEEIRGLGLVPVQRRQDSVIAAYATDHDLTRFEDRTASYESGRLKLGALAKIEHVRPWSREDRMSNRLRATPIDLAAEYIVDVLLLPLADEEPNRQALRLVEAYVTGARGAVLDRVQERTFTAVRVRLGGQSLDTLLDYRDDIAEIDLPPKAQITVPEIAGFKLDSIPEVVAPAATLPAICIVDSGIVEGHPLLEPAVLLDLSRSFPASLGPPIPNVGARENGHGTQVAGVAVYADVAGSVARKSFEPHAWVVNARVLDDNAEFHPSRMPFLRDVVEHARDRCRVFNLSYGMEPCRGYLSPQAVELDELSREFGVLCVVASGNEVPDGDAAASAAQYPEHLADPSWKVRAPAEALTALTVGSVTPDADPSSTDRRPGAPKRCPSPFSRAGGLKGVVKPEVVELGGNLAFAGNPPRWVPRDSALEVATTGHRVAQGELLAFARGTSIATPKVAHLVAHLLERYPEATPNLLRALVVNSAALPEGVREWDQKDVLATCGFGVPVLDRALYCHANRVTLYHEGLIEMDEVKVFDVPVPRELAAAKGKKTITVTLAYDPPVSATDRERPAGVRLTWGLARGDRDEAEVEKAIAAQAEADVTDGGAEEPAATGKARSVFMASKLPKRPQQRGTVQKCRFEWSRGDYGDTYRLAVTARAIRPKHAQETQRFAVVVMLECEDTSVNVYNVIRTRVAAGRVRIKA